MEETINKPTMVFNEGDWRILASGFHKGVWHKCKEGNYTFIGSSIKCHYCKTNCPDKVVTIAKLFDLL